MKSSIRSNYVSDDSDSEYEVGPGPADYAKEIIEPNIPRLEEF